MTYFSRNVAAALAATVIGLAATGAPTGADADTRLLRFGDFGPSQSARADALRWIDAELRARTDGALGIDFVWGGALVGATTAVESIADGVADMGSVVPVYAPGRLVTYELADVIQFSDEWVGMNAVYDLMTTNEDAIREWEAANLVYFGNFTTGPTQLLSKEPVRTLEDLNGLTIRATGSFVPAFKAFGAGTVSLGQPKVYEALSNGTVNATTTYFYTTVSYKHYEQAGHITEIDLGQVLGFGIAMNKDTFESLSEEHQRIVMEIGSDFTREYFAKIMHDSRISAREKLKAGIDGYTVEVHDPAPGMSEALLEIASADSGEWIQKAGKKGLAGETLLAKYQSLIDKYTAERDANGYPWER